MKNTGKFLFLLVVFLFFMNGCSKNPTFTKHQPFVVESTAPISDSVSKYITKRGDFLSAPAVIYAPAGMFEVGDTIYLSKTHPK